MAEVFKNQNYVKLVIDYAHKSIIKEANLIKIVNENEDFKIALNEALGNEIKAESFRTEDDDDLFSALAAQLSTEDGYIPTVVIANIESLDPNASPIVSPGLELDEDIDTTLDDHIWAKIQTENQELLDIIINEEDALSTTNPVLIFANGIDETIFGDGIVVGEGLTDGRLDMGGSGKTQTAPQFDFLKVAIKDDDYFYESSGKNEYQYTGYYFTNEEVWGWIFNEQQSSHRIRRFKSDQCNGTEYGISEEDDEFYNGSLHTPQATGDIIVFMNTYERDWYASIKPLGSTTIKGQTCNLSGKMVYTWQWYAADPGQPDQNNGGVLFTGGPLPIDYVSVKDNAKTILKVIRYH